MKSVPVIIGNDASCNGSHSDYSSLISDKIKATKEDFTIHGDKAGTKTGMEDLQKRSKFVLSRNSSGAKRLH